VFYSRRELREKPFWHVSPGCGIAGLKLLSVLLITASAALAQSSPTVTSISPTLGAAGSTLTVTLTGSGFVPGATSVSLTDTQTSVASVSNVNVTSSTSLTGSLTIPASTSPDDYYVSVSTPNGTSSRFGPRFGVFQPLAPPGIQNVLPERGIAGTTFTGTIIGANLLNNVTSVIVGGGGVTVTILDGRTSWTLPVQFTIANDAAIGVRSVSIIAPAGSATNGRGFTVVGGGWSPTGNLFRPRRPATVLLDGTVLAAGGCLGSAELYNPATGNWSATGFLTTSRGGQTATLLPNGKVLVAGGVDVLCSSPVQTAEIYDPATRSWTAVPPMRFARMQHTATLLPTGKVLIIGGYPGGPGGGPPFSSAELFDPDSLSWSPAADMPTGRTRHTVTVLANGKILIAGGVTDVSPTGTTTFSNSAVLYDPVSNSWTSTGAMSTYRQNYAASILPDGRVLVAGGGAGIKTAEIYDPNLGIWTSAGAMAFARYNHAAVTLPNGKVLVTGGADGLGYPPWDSTEIFDVATGTWSLVDLMNEARSSPFAVLLNTNKVLTIGPSQTAELYDPRVSNPSPTLSSVTPNVVPVGSGSTAVQLSGSNFLPNSIASVGSSPLVTTYLGSTKLLAYLPSSSLSGPTALQISVRNPSPGGGVSSSQTVTVSQGNPVPAITAISPASVMSGSSTDINLTVNGTNFVAGSFVRLDDTDLQTAFVSGTTLNAVIPATRLSSAGTFHVSVFNPLPGGGTSASLGFTVIASTQATPAITAISPITAAPGSVFIMAVTGTNLGGATAAVFSGGGITATIGPGGTATSLSLRVTVTTGAEAGPRTLSVTTPAGASAPFSGFTVQWPPSPRPTSAPQRISEVEDGNVQTGYLVITPDQNTSAPFTTLTYGTVRNGMVQDQASVVPLGATTGAILFIDFLNSASRNLGLVIVNPGSTTNAITITLKNDDGTTASTATVNIDPYKQVAKFVNELFPDAVGLAFVGSINVQSGSPFAVLGFPFAGANFSTLGAGNTGTLTAVPTRIQPAGSGPAGSIGGVNAILLPQFVMGGGWATQVALVNMSVTAATGRIDVFDTNGQPKAVKFNGDTKSTFTYSIPAGGTFIVGPRDENGQTPL